MPPSAPCSLALTPFLPVCSHSGVFLEGPAQRKVNKRASSASPRSEAAPYDWLRSAWHKAESDVFTVEAMATPTRVRRGLDERVEYADTPEDEAALHCDVSFETKG
jgi:hypothetical protein